MNLLKTSSFFELLKKIIPKSKKEKAIKSLNNTFCRLQPSSISGIGVFAIRTIPKGINPFQGSNKHTWIRIKKSELFKKIPRAIHSMISDFFVTDVKENVELPMEGLNSMDISYFLNHSDIPNMIIDKDGFFITLHEIPKGTELTIDYSTYDDGFKPSDILMRD